MTGSSLRRGVPLCRLDGKTSTIFIADSDAAALADWSDEVGAPREAYFEGLRDWAVSGRPSDEEAAAFYLRHDNILGSYRAINRNPTSRPRTKRQRDPVLG